MGNLLVVSMDKIASVVSAPYHVVMLGLDNSGKTSLLYKAKLKETIPSHPTMSFNVECVSVTKKLKFKIWDIGGRESNRPLWRPYVRKTQGVVFVVDSVDHTRLEEARHELFNVVNSESAQLCQAPILIIANKQDCVGAMSPEMIAKELKLEELSKRHPWHVEGTSCYVGDGFNEGLKNLGKMIALWRGETTKQEKVMEKPTKRARKNTRKTRRRHSSGSHEGILI